MENYSGSYQNGSNISNGSFERLAQTVATNIQKILQNVTYMEQVVSKIGTPQDNQQLISQLHQKQHYTGQLAKDTSSRLNELSEVNGLSNQYKVQRERLREDFTKSLHKFQEAQRKVADKEKDIIKRKKYSMDPMNQPVNLIDVEAGASNDQNVSYDQNKTQLMIEEENRDLQQLYERECAVRQLESDIVDVNTIFRDLATMVHEQGEFVDSIEANIESTHVRVHEGTEQMRQAEAYKNKTRKKKVILAVICVIILAIIIILIANYSN